MPPEPTSLPELGAENPKIRAKCQKPLVGVRLIQMETCEYFRSRQEVPPVGTFVSLRPGVDTDRVLAVETEEGQRLGHLDPSFSYLFQCLSLGYTYTGRIVASAKEPEPTALVDLTPRA